MKMIYNVEDKPAWSKLLVFAFQQVLAIMAATIAVPHIIGLDAQIPAAILGAGVGTIVYLLFTRFKSPVCISSSFAFLSSLFVALTFGYCGIIVGGILAGLVYVIIAIVIHFVGTKWVSKLMPPVIIGPTVALIGLSLAGNAVGDFVKASASSINGAYNWVSILCALVTLITIIVCSIQKKRKGLRLIPFIVGIGAGYLCALIFTLIGYGAHADYLMVLDWSPLVNNFSPVKFTSFLDYPHFALVEGIKELANGTATMSWAGLGEIALAFIPVALVVFAEHIADHKNLGSIIERDLVEGEPGLERTLLGDGVGSIAGTVFGICPNTTYGESVGCVAITRNASVRTIFVAACMCIVLSFVKPLMVILQTIPSCVMGGVCLTLYGFIAVSGLKMFKDIDLGENKNLFTVSAILIAGIGGLSIQIPYALIKANVPTIGYDAAGNAIELYDSNGNQLFDALAGQPAKVITVTSIATALILGICIYAICNFIEKKQKDIPDDGEAESLMAAPIESGSTYEVGGEETVETVETTDGDNE
ncbi:MAG: uracil-xanthine permease [Clostridia bacterium]|nr:uracil-xanthine permease [Clostridia bacterium]